MTAAAQVGLRYARANLLIGPGGEAAALYRLDGVNYPLLSTAEKWQVARRLEHLAHHVRADFSLWRVWRGLGSERYTPAGPAGCDAFAGLVAAHRTAIDRLDARCPETYLAVALDAPVAGGFGRVLLDAADRARDRLTSLSKRRVGASVTGSDLKRLATAERQLFERLAGVVSLRRAKTAELEWLLSRAPLRAISEPEPERFWAPDALVLEPTDPGGEMAYEPLGHDLWRLPAAVLFEDPDHPPSLRVEADSATGYQALLALGSLAEEPVFPGPAAELLHGPLDSLPFPVDAVLHARWLGNREALGKVRKRIVDAEQTYRDQLESTHGPAWSADDDRTLAREYEQVLQSGARPPMLYARLSLAVGADSREELEGRVEALRTQFGDIALHRPRGLQERLWLDHLPRPDGGRVRDYTQQVTAQQFGAMVPTATCEAGDPHGLYLGYTTGGARRPVLYDPTAPSRESRASAVLLAGTLGSGKTVAAQLIAHAALLSGSQVVDFDPKPDHGWTNLQEIADRVGVLELAGTEEQQGALDPMAIAISELREELAISYLLDLVSDPPGSWEHAIARAVRDTVKAGQRTTTQVLRRLRALDGTAGREAADALDVLAEVGLARLGFAAEQPVDAEPGAVRALTTIRTPGLTLPEPGVARETYTRAERISVATLSLVAALALRLVSQDRHRHKLVVLDEAWFLLASSQGRALINRLVRLARAYNATVLLATQRLDDIGPVGDLVGTALVFGQDSDTQATAALELLGLQPTPARVARLRGARAGRCLMRDLEGRVAEIQVDCPDPRLLAAFDTTPGGGRS